MANAKIPRNNCLNCKKECVRAYQKYCSNSCQHLWQNQQKYSSGKYLYLRPFLLKLKGNQCELCFLKEWKGCPIPLIVDHIDGNSSNNLPDNLRLVCPNCDAQLPTYKYKNKGNGRAYRRKRYSEGKSY